VAQDGASEFGKEALDKVEPGAVLRSEGKLEAVRARAILAVLFATATETSRAGFLSSSALIHRALAAPFSRAYRIIAVGPTTMRERK
jgi:hypothetical protein